jgi:hypothetical protein
LAHYVALAETAGPHLRSREQIAWASALVLETDNFRTALDWAVEATLPDEGLRLVIPLMVTGIPTGWIYTDWPDVARSIPGAATHELFPLAAAYAAMGMVFRGERKRAADLVAIAEAAQAALGTTHLWVYAAAGTAALFRGDKERTRQHAEAWAELARIGNDVYERAKALTLLAAALADDPARGGVVAEEAVRAARQVGAADALLYALLAQGLALAKHNPERALRSSEEAADVAASLGDRFGAAAAITNQGGIALRRGDWRTALRAYVAGAEQHMHLGQPLYDELVGMAAALVGLGCLEPAAVIFGLAHAVFSAPVPTRLIDDLVCGAEDAVSAAFDPDRLAELKARGAAMDLPSAAAYLRREVDRILN